MRSLRLFHQEICLCEGEGVGSGYIWSETSLPPLCSPGGGTSAASRKADVPNSAGRGQEGAGGGSSGPARGMRLLLLFLCAIFGPQWIKDAV